jgi:hypothetical protein
MCLADLQRAHTPRCRQSRRRHRPQHGGNAGGANGDDRDSARDGHGTTTGVGRCSASTPTGIVNWCGDATGPVGDVGSSFTRADRGGYLSLPGPGLCTGDTLGMTALGVQGPDVNNEVGPSRGGGIRTSSQSACGSITGLGSRASNLNGANLGGDITRAGGAALGGRGDIFNTNNSMSGAGMATVNDGVSLSTGGANNTLGAGDGGNVRPSNGDVLGGIPVGGGVGLRTGALGNNRGDVNRGDDGVLHNELSAQSGSGN